MVHSLKNTCIPNWHLVTTDTPKLVCFTVLLLTLIASAIKNATRKKNKK